MRIVIEGRDLPGVEFVSEGVPLRNVHVAVQIGNDRSASSEATVTARGGRSTCAPSSRMVVWWTCAGGASSRR
jgi:hypothetical protein